MRSLFRPLVGVALGILIVLGSLVARAAYADTGSAVTAGSASSGSGSAVAAPADQLPDAVAHPADAITAEKAAYNKAGWPLAVLAGLIMIGRGLGAVSKKWAPLAWLGKGRAAVLAAGGVTLAIAAFNALALGGTWYAAIVAAASAGFALMRPHAEPQPAPAS